MTVVAFLMFFLAGFGFGFAAPAGWKWLPLVFPLGLFLIAVFQEGADGTVVVRLIVALLITVAGVLLGSLLAQRSERRDSAVRLSS